MKKCFIILLVLLVSWQVEAQKNKNSGEDCNCNGRQFQEKYEERYNEDTYLSDYLLDFKVDSGEDNLDYVYSQMKDKLTLSLAKKIRNKVSSTETMKISSISENNANEKTKQDFTATAKSESNVVLSGTEFHICPDRKHSDIFHGMIYLNKTQFLSSQIALLKITLKDLEVEVNNLAKNAMDYSNKQLAKEIVDCIRKKNKVDDIIGIYTTMSTKNEIMDDANIQKSKDNINSKLSSLKKKVKDID